MTGKKIIKGLEEAVQEERLTEPEWQDRHDLRQHWADFCNADYHDDGFIERMEAAGLAHLRNVVVDDLDEPFAAERGIEPGGMLWELTSLGHAVLARAPDSKRK
jgi:hypothetical protein